MLSQASVSQQFSPPVPPAQMLMPSQQYLQPSNTPSNNTGLSLAEWAKRGMINFHGDDAQTLMILHQLLGHIPMPSPNLHHTPLPMG